MSTHDAQFLKDASAERRSDGGWTFANPWTALRYVSLIFSGVVAGLFYPAAFGWLFGISPGETVLFAAAAIGGGLGLVAATVLGSGRTRSR